MGQQSVPEKRKSRVVGVGCVTLCYIFGGVLMLVGGIKIASIVWYSLKHGPIPAHAERPLSEIAITPLNLVRCAVLLGAGVMLWVVAGSIWNRKPRLAIVGFILAVAFYIGVVLLSP